jgi:ABC-type Mn2+/Zn2+ transport system ATPase subunit
MIIFVKTIVMEALDKKPVFKSADEIIRLMLESKKQSKIETEEFAKTEEFQEILKRLREKKLRKNGL